AVPGQAGLGPPPGAGRRRGQTQADRHRPPRGPRRAAAPAEEADDPDRPAQAHPRPGGAGRPVRPRPRRDRAGQEKGWDVDYYMCCLYYLTRPREELHKLLGPALPLGEIYLPTDPPRMFRVVKAVKKPCLVYKVLAAGRRVGSAAEVRACFETALKNI